MPVVPGALGVAFGRARFEEPGVLVRGMVYNEVDHKFHVALLEAGDQGIDVGESSVAWVDVFVVRDVVAEVYLGTFEEG
jgi:hypothetical protein